ncbi:MAG: exonuclease SbcCD subunit D [Nocardioides sp.]
MRILHTSDWHIGRSFHGHSTLGDLRAVMAGVVEAVRTEAIEVVLVSGDVFDSTTPSADAVALLDEVLGSIRDAGAQVVLSSGNHDSPARLGAKAAFASLAGVHVVTGIDQVGSPITIADRYGDVHFYPVPFLAPILARNTWPDVDPMRSQADAIAQAMRLVRADLAGRGGRAVVLAHTFCQGAEGESCDSERDILGGIDKVPVAAFDGVDYAALGHIHSPMTLSESVRYSGAPLRYSFSEAAKARGGWLVDLDATGLAGVVWVDLAVPRGLARLRGDLEDLLDSAELETFVDHWVEATLTDNTRPMDALRRIQTRFRFCASLIHAPADPAVGSTAAYADRVRGRTDTEIIDAFCSHVRNGEGLSAAEAGVVAEVLAAREAEVLAR